MDKQLELEFWMPVRGYEGLYEVSSLGRVRSLGHDKWHKGRILKLIKSKKTGYLKVGIFNCGVGKQLLVHRLVWSAFNSPIQEGYELDHVNTVRDDNRLSNLRCVTHKENQNNPISKIRHAENTKNARKKTVLQLKKDGEVIRRWECIMDAERELGIDSKNIPACCNGKRKSTGGFKWSYFWPPAIISNSPSLH